jgi:hypothetical protein
LAPWLRAVSCALQNEAAAMQQTLEETLARFDDVQAQTATIEEEVVDEVCLFNQASFKAIKHICK